MSPLNRGPLLGPRIPPAGIRPPPPPRFGGRLPLPGLPPRMPPPPMSPVFGPMRQRLPPPPRLGATRPAGPLPLFGPRGRGIPPMVRPMGLRPAGPRGPPMRPWPRRAMPPQIMSHMRPRFVMGNGNVKGKATSNVKKVNKLEELELKKPWMTDEIRSEIQKKNKLYAKAKKNKDAKEWEEFKDLRNKVTRMIRDAKNDYLAKHPEQGGQKTDDKSTIESEGVQKTENATEQSEQMEQTEETQPTSEQAHLYPDDQEPYDRRDENYVSSEDEMCHYCEVCDRDFASEENLLEHKLQHKLCGIDGCTFSAHPLLVERHINMQHSTGLYQRMRNLSTPEDIEKWLLERKKKYPTKANIELRKAEETEKVERGEIIQQKQEVVNHKTKRMSNPRDKRRKSQRRPMKTFDSVLPESEVYRGVNAFPGTLNLPQIDESQREISNGAIEKSEEAVNHISDEEELPVASVKSVNTNSLMPTLVANYGSDSEDDPPDEVPIKKVRVLEDDVTNESVTKGQSIHNAFPRSDIKGYTSLQTPKSVASTNTQTNVQGKQKTELNRNSKDRVQTMSTNRKQPNRLQLLDRLLSRSIQHERNLICQCIKYIADNNFFE